MNMAEKLQYGITNNWEMCGMCCCMMCLCAEVLYH